MFKAELQEEISKAIPRIVECLKHSSSSAKALSSLGVYRTCPSVSPLLLSLNDVQSGISRGDLQGHTLHC
jgi:hypothetical protein